MLFLVIFTISNLKKFLILYNKKENIQLILTLNRVNELKS